MKPLIQKTITFKQNAFILYMFRNQKLRRYGGRLSKVFYNNEVCFQNVNIQIFDKGIDIKLLIKKNETFKQTNKLVFK